MKDTMTVSELKAALAQDERQGQELADTLQRTLDAYNAARAAMRSYEEATRDRRWLATSLKELGVEL